MLLLIKEHHNYYGIDAKVVHEVLQKTVITKVARSPEYIIGLCNYKNTAVPVLSFSSLAGEKPNPEAGMMVIVENGEDLAALLVEELGEFTYVESYHELKQDYIEETGQKLRFEAIYAGEPTIFKIDIRRTLENLTV